MQKEASKKPLFQKNLYLSHPFSIIQLFLFNLKTTFFRILEWLKVLFLYYRNSTFLKTDLLFALNYTKKTPHQLSKMFLKKRGEENVYAYGGTPITTLAYIAKECRILSNDTLVELGCGSGRNCFWLKAFIGCRVIGVDYLSTFIQKAQVIKEKMHLNGIDFLHQDMLKVDLKEATVIYLYGTCLDESMIQQLIDRFRLLPRDAKIITVSYPLTDYAPHLFRLEKEFIAPFPWGKAPIFLNTLLV